MGFYPQLAGILEIVCDLDFLPEKGSGKFSIT